MAACEKCGKGGFAPIDMFIEFDKFVGPCCSGPGMGKVQSLPLPPLPQNVRVLTPVQLTGDVEYGFEVSNKVGVRAYANYHGLQLSFERSPEQIRSWAQRQGLITEKAG